MSENDDINERLARIERDLSWIIQYLLKKDEPLQPPPYIPNPWPNTTPSVPRWPDRVSCSKCGMDWSGVMGYVCMDNKCPMQMKITS